MGADNYRCVLEQMRLASGQLFPIPITLPVLPEAKIKLDQEIALLDSRNELIAVMTVQEIYEWDLEETAHLVFGTNDLRHPLVAEMHRWGTRNISGPIKVLRLPRHYDFRELRLSPAETREQLEKIGSRKTSLLFRRATPCIGRTEISETRHPRGRRRLAATSRRRYDKTRRHRPLHAGSHIQGTRTSPLRSEAHSASTSSPCDATRWTKRGALARPNQTKPRREPSDHSCLGSMPAQVTTQRVSRFILHTLHRS